MICKGIRYITPGTQGTDIFICIGYICSPTLLRNRKVFCCAIESVLLRNRDEDEIFL